MSRRRKGRAWSKKGIPPHRAPYLETLEACREAWQEARNPNGLWWGLIICSMDDGIPPWLAAALINVLKMRRMHRYWRTYLDRLNDYVRFVYVRDGRRRGLTFEQAYEAASTALAKTSSFGGPDAMKASYRRVARTDPAHLGRYAIAPPKE